MTWAAPWFLVGAAGVGALVVALHLLARQRPRVAPLPTARFVPERPAVAPSRSTRPTDLLLLALRLAVVLLAGAAFARPQWSGERRSVGRVVMLDVSRAVASWPEARDSAAAIIEPGDVLIPFDTAARAIAQSAVDSLGTRAVSRAPGSLSSAMVQALRAGTSLRDQVDSLELVIVSPLAVEELDSATSRLRALWAGRARLVRVRAARDPAAPGSIELRVEADDPLAATVALLGAPRTGTAARLVRTATTPEDSAWARDSGGVLVTWPRQPGGAASTSSGSADSVGAVWARDVTVVAPFARRSPAMHGRAVAWWADGAVAAVERGLGAGCIREVAIDVPHVGDLVLRESFRRLVSILVEPCGGARRLEPLGDSLVESLANAGPLLSAAALPRPPAREPSITTWLLAGALALVLGEMLLRRRRSAP
jgi:hypothetical protein